jgi:hypothetical protein
MARELPRFIDRAALDQRVAAMPLPQDPEPGTDEYQVVSWLTRLHLLLGVPFAYLVPDIGMLPAESIRFFQLDNGWIEALIDGAFGVGAPRATASSGAALRAAQAAPETITGFLLRSAAVSGWPGLETRCFADTAGQQKLPLVRLERVAPAVLLGLAGGVLRRVDLGEPPEGVHFGVDPAAPATTAPPTTVPPTTGPPDTGPPTTGPPDTAAWQKQLRYASGNATTPVGSWIPGQVQPVPLRPGPMNVIKISALAQAMAPHVWAPPSSSGEGEGGGGDAVFTTGEAEGGGGDAVFTSAQFGLEMVEGVQSVSFQVGT